jgi:tetratricopeptide (TPR) repeat protein
MYKMGRLDEALDLGRRVLTQDPLSAAYWHNLGLTCHAAGLLDESEDAFRRALELAPRRFVTAALLALVLTDKGQLSEALSEVEREADDFWRAWSLAIIYYTSGEVAKSDEALNKLVDQNAEGNAYQLAEIYSMRGDGDNAFQWLQRAIADRDPGVTHAKVNPRFRLLHDDTRWREVLKEIGF